MRLAFMMGFMYVQRIEYLHVFTIVIYLQYVVKLYKSKFFNLCKGWCWGETCFSHQTNILPLQIDWCIFQRRHLCILVGGWLTQLLSKNMFKLVLTFYHGKWPLNHHLVGIGFLFSPTAVSKSKLGVFWRTSPIEFIVKPSIQKPWCTWHLFSAGNEETVDIWKKMLI